MSKHYIKLPEHGGNGDFYQYNGNVYRADNLEIATQIAFNQWLEGFNNFRHECTLKSLTPGRFEVQTDEELVVEDNISYYGPPDMFTPVYQLANCANAEVKHMATALAAALSAGHPAVRKSNTSGAVIFTEKVFVGFKRFDANGEYISGVDRHLSIDPVIAKMQMETAGISY